MHDARVAAPITRAHVLRRAWPIIVANATVPMVGLIDTAVIGHAGRVVDLGAIALGTLVFNSLYFGVGFLRMGTTGFIAQAVGVGDELEVRAVLGRALVLAGAIGAVFVAFKSAIAAGSMQLLHATPTVERIAAEYIELRLWAAPAVLLTLALRGALIGLGYGRDLLLLEGSLNGINLALNFGFVVACGWGARGVAIGTALAECLGLMGAVAIVRLRLHERRAGHSGNDAAARAPLMSWRRIWQPAQLRAMLGANADIWLRTVLLLFGFAYFTDRSAGFGESILAGNHLLLQFVSFSAFFLDGYANVAESLVGEAVGARDRRGFDLAVRRSSELAVLSAALGALALWFLGGALIDLLTNLSRVRAAAREHLPFASLYVLLSVATFQLDGIFVGATRTRAMRNAALGAASLFLVTGWGLANAYGNRGLWCAFIVFVVARALALGAYYPGLRRSLA